MLDSLAREFYNPRLKFEYYREIKPMRNVFFKTIQSTTLTAPLALFAAFYTKAILHAYHESMEHEAKMKKYYEENNITPIESSFWSRFKNAYLPLFPLIPENKTPHSEWPQHKKP